ncbi:GxxExxY protein [Bacteroidota bacterium]
MISVKYKSESYKIVGACMAVHCELGSGFHESVYQEAAEIEFHSRNIPYDREKELEIIYKKKVLNKKYIADFICYDKIIVEFKAVSELNDNHFSQVIGYLKATGFEMGMLINFGKESLEYRRVLL